MVQDFLPAMRLLVSRKLRSQGLSQTRIASILGTTQASVSMYLSSDPSKAYSQLSRFSVSPSDADGFAALLAEDAKRSPLEGIRRLTSAWTSLLGRGVVCDAHRRIYPSLAECDFCIKEYASAAKAPSMVSEVADAVRLLEGSRAFADAMPEVSVNIVCCLEDASTSSDVVAIPGRIVKVKDQARATMPPEPGASVHMSGILLEARKKNPALGACINLRHDRRMAGVLKRLRLNAVSLENYPEVKGGDPTLEALKKRLENLVSDFDVIIDQGREGIEPNIYIFGRSAMDATRVAIRVAEAYSAN